MTDYDPVAAVQAEMEAKRRQNRASLMAFIIATHRNLKRHHEHVGGVLHTWSVYRAQWPDITRAEVRAQLPEARRRSKAVWDSYDEIERRPGI